MDQLSQLLSKLGGCLKNVLPTQKFLTKVELFVRITIFIVVKTTHSVVFIRLRIVCCYIKIKKNLTKLQCMLGFDHDRIRHQTRVVPAISDNVANNGGADV